MSENGVDHIGFASVSEIAERIFRGIPSLPQRTQTETHPVPFINIKDIVAGRIDPEGVDAVSISISEKRYQVRAGDVILSCRGTVLKSAVITEELAGAVPSSNLTVIRLKPGFSPELLAAFFQSPSGQKRLLSGVQSSTQQKALSIAEIEAIAIPLPPIERQRMLADLIAAADRYYAASVEAAALRREIAYAIACGNMTLPSSMPSEAINE